MKLKDLRRETHDNYIQEMAELFMAYGQYKAMLGEGLLDEASAWQKVKGAVGKGIAGVKTANDAINKLGALAQKTGPVQDFDDKVEVLLKKIGDKNPKVAELAKKYGDWAKKNPVKQGLIVGMLTATASVLAGPAGGAAAGAVLRAGNELLKGEKASTAIGKAAKTAAVGAAFGGLAGVSVDAIGQAFKAAEPVMEPLKQFGELRNIRISHQINGVSILNINQVLPKDVADRVLSINRQLTAAMQMGAVDSQRAASLLRELEATVNDRNIAARVEQIVTQNNAIRAENDAIRQAFANRVEQVAQTNAQIDRLIDKISSGTTAAVQGAAAASDSNAAAKPAAKPADTPTPAAQPMSPERRAELKARQQAWKAQQQRMGKKL